MQSFVLSKRGMTDSVRSVRRPRKVVKSVLLAFVAFCGSSALAVPPADKQGSSAVTPAPSGAHAMVEALANRNPVPDIPAPRYNPIFAKNYDRSECKRAAAAFHALIDHAEDAWPEMVAHLDDGRYSVTFYDSAESERAYNWTIGDICQEIIIGSLTEGYLQNLRQKDKVSYFRLQDFVRDKKSLKSWCEARRTKRLYELQIDVCQWAVAELDKGDFGRVPNSRRLEWIAAVKSEIERLKASKEPYRLKGFGESVELYYGHPGK